MMRRLFWMGVGATITVVVVVKVAHRVRPYTPNGIADSVKGWTDGARDTTREIRETMATHEADLRAMLIEDVGEPGHQARDARRPAATSWATRHDDDDEPFSF